MLIFGCCVGPSGKFETVARPALSAVMGPDDVLIEEEGSDGICAAYNRVLSIARTTPDCEGVVLLHDDTELGAGTRNQLSSALREPCVGVVGVVGGRDLHGPIWVDARRTAGVANDVYGTRVYGPSTADVDVVDGLLLALAPAAFAAIDFDSVTFPAFHAYDTDYCLQVRASGLRVRVVPLQYRHADKGDLGDRDAFDEGFARLRSKWPAKIRPLGRLERVRLGIRTGWAAHSGRARHRILDRVKRVRSR